MKFVSKAVFDKGPIFHYCSSIESCFQEWGAEPSDRDQKSQSGQRNAAIKSCPFL